MAVFDIKHSGDDTILRNRYGTYSRKELEKQLKDGHLTVKELASVYSLKPGQMTHVMRTLNIEYRNPLNHTRVFDAHIDLHLHQVLLGTLMGDGYFRNSKCYGLGHGVYQMDYCYHVAECLHPFVASFGDKDTGGSTEKSFEFWTYRHDVFTPYFERFYPDGTGKKRFTSDTVPDLDERGLAYWYMDDGKWSNHGARLCVGSISDKEGGILIDLLHNRFGLGCTFQCHDLKKQNHTIYILANSRRAFFELINPHVIPSMRYKIVGGSPPRIAFDKQAVASRHKKLCARAGRHIRYFGDPDVKVLVNSGDKDGPKEAFIRKIQDDISSGRQISETCFLGLPSEAVLKSLWTQGLTDEQVAEHCGVGRNRAGSIRRSLGLDRRSSRSTKDKLNFLHELFEKSGMTVREAMKETNLSFYKIKQWLIETGRTKCHQRVVKEKTLADDLRKLSFDPSSAKLSDYVFSREDMIEEIKEFLERYEWLRTVGVTAKWCFTMRLRGHLSGVQILNEPASYSRALGIRTPEWECLIQRGCTISWGHEHLGSRMLMQSIDWIVKNTGKRVFVGYADPRAGEVGVIYQACNFQYLGDSFGVKCRYRHPTYKKGKDFCEHSLRRTSVFKKWCRDNGIPIEPSWIKPNGFKDVKKIPSEIKKAWYDWGKGIIQEARKINVDQKGKYILIRGSDRRENRYLRSLFRQRTYPYPKRALQPEN